MARTCIVYRKELRNVVSIGRAKGIVVSFCYDHAAMCDKCEDICCRLVK